MTLKENQSLLGKEDLAVRALAQGINTVIGVAETVITKPADTKVDILYLKANIGIWLVRLGVQLTANFTAAVTDIITKAAHGLESGDGPYRLSPSADTGQLPVGLTPFKSTGILDFGANAGNGKIVTIDSKVYTFQTTLTNVDGNVHIGASASDTLDNLIAAITLGSGGGSEYAAAMTEHPSVHATAGSGDTMDAIAKTAGVAGDVVSTTDVVSATWSGATLEGGLDEVDYWAVVIDEDTFKVALSYDDAVAATPVVVDITDTGTGTHTMKGMPTVVTPTETSSDGLQPWKLLQGDELPLAGPTQITVKSFNATDELSYFWL